MQLSLGLGALLLLSGCGFLAAAAGQFEEPEIRIAHSRVDHVGASRLSVTLGLAIENPNAYALRISDLKYNIDIGDRTVGRGEYTEIVNIAAGATATVPLAIELDLGTALAVLLRALSLGELPYRLTASANAAAMFIEQPISHSEASVLRIVPPYGLGWLGRAIQTGQT